MSLSKILSSPFEIHPDLHHEPRVRYPAWKAAILEIAILQCQTQHVSGCLFMVQTDTREDKQSKTRKQIQISVSIG